MTNPNIEDGGEAVKRKQVRDAMRAYQAKAGGSATAELLAEHGDGAIRFGSGKNAEGDLKPEFFDVVLAAIKAAPVTDSHEIAERPTVKIKPSLMHKSMARVQDILARERRKLKGGIHDPIFQRQGYMVRLSRNLLDPDAPPLKEYERAALHVIQIESPWLARRLDRTMQFLGKQKDPDEPPPPINVPAVMISSLMADATNWNKQAFPILHATIEAPTLRLDGTILDQPGYDVETGLHYDPADVKFPAVPKSPTHEQGKAACAAVEDVLQDFPFADDVSKAVAMALLFTAPVRRTLDIAPGFGIDADDAEAGKTTLAKVAGAIMTGRDVAVKALPTKEEEREKTIGADLYASSAVLLFDNIDDVIEGKSLDMVLTSPSFEFRLLGESRIIHVPTCALTIFTANKITVAGNLTTRVLVSRLVPDRPLAQRKFAYRNLVAHVIEHRPELVAAILTALRAYIVHGQADVVAAKIAADDDDRFHQWSDLIRGALVWYGYADPQRGGDTLREADPIKECQREAIRQWAAQHDEKIVTAADLAKHHAIREAFAPLMKDQKRRGEVTGHNIGQLVPQLIGVRLGLGWQVEKLPGRRSRAQAYRLVWTAGDPTA